MSTIALLASIGYACQASSSVAQSSRDERRIVGQFDQDYGCYVNAMIDGTPFRMLVDTGSDDVVFSRRHLPKLGIKPGQLIYNMRVDTPEGIIRSAPILVHELRIGTFVLHDVAAYVDYSATEDALLGMSVIRHMQLEIGRDGCQLRW